MSRSAIDFLRNESSWWKVTVLIKHQFMTRTKKWTVNSCSINYPYFNWPARSFNLPQTKPKDLEIAICIHRQTVGHHSPLVWLMWIFKSAMWPNIQNASAVSVSSWYISSRKPWKMRPFDTIQGSTTRSPGLDNTWINFQCNGLSHVSYGHHVSYFAHWRWVKPQLCITA